MRVACLGLIFLLALPALAADVDAGKKYEIPYRLTDTKHILVRARINGKGPFHFIIDTGAPVLLVSATACKKAGVEANEDGVATVDRFELEGGLGVSKLKIRTGDIAQLDGINKLGLAGVTLDGVIGYEFLARYRIEYDFSKDKLAWTRLDFDPPPPKVAGKLVGGADSMVGLVSVASKILGPGNAARAPRVRGFLGMEVATRGAAVVVAAVLKDGPAAAAGLEVGDRVTHVDDQEVKQPGDVIDRANRLEPGDTLRVTFVRGQETRQIAVALGKGF